MKTSDLINRLQLVLEAYGDLPVYWIDGDEAELQELEPPRLFTVTERVIWSLNVQNGTAIIVV